MSYYPYGFHSPSLYRRRSGHQMQLFTSPGSPWTATSGAWNATMPGSGGGGVDGGIAAAVAAAQQQEDPLTASVEKLPKTESDVLDQTNTVYLLENMKTLADAADFIALATSKTMAGKYAETHLHDALRASRVCVEEAEIFVDGVERDIDRKLDELRAQMSALESTKSIDVAKARTVLASIKGEEGIFRRAEDSLLDIQRINNGELPDEGKITELFLVRKFKDLPEGTLKTMSSPELAEIVHCPSDGAIVKHSHPESVSILRFLRANHITPSSQAIRPNVELYKRLGVLPKNFNMARIQGSEKHNVETLHGFLGLYFGKVDTEWAKNLVFHPKEVPGECPWIACTKPNVQGAAPPAGKSPMQE